MNCDAEVYFVGNMCGCH